jgi:DNA-binding PadR family transcriptional regulator
MNISQEALSDTELLHEKGLLSALQMPSSSYKPIICYQVSDKGKEIVKSALREDTDAVLNAAYTSVLRNRGNTSNRKHTVKLIMEPASPKSVFLAMKRIASII